MSNINVRIVKLKTGEELIAAVWSGTERILLKKPCILLPTSVLCRDTAQNHIGIEPWGFSTKEFHQEGISIPRTEVLYEATPVDDLCNKYNSIFGSERMASQTCLYHISGSIAERREFSRNRKDLDNGF